MMRLCSPQSNSTGFLLPTSPNSCANLANFNANPNFYRTKLTINIIVLLVKSPHISSRSCFATPLPDPVLCSESKEPNAEQREEEGEGKEALEGLILPVRRPVKQSSDEAIDSCDNVNENVGMNDSASDSKIDRSLSKLAKKMPIFEPKRGVTPEQKPLRINLELGIYRAKVFTLKFKFEEANQILQKCIWFWPEDGRAYVALGKLLCRQSKLTEARLVYEKGSQATQGENSYIWQCWAVLESKVGNIRRARELFDAATVADKKHVAAWHGWAVLEIKQGNLKKARSLLGKGLKYCGGNEYIYQTLALLESKGNRFEEARYLFQKATQCNPKSCASWLAWAQAEFRQKKYHLARVLFQKAVQASPKNRYAWHVWALFEANRGDIEKGRKLLKVGHALNPFDPVLLQSLALFEYKHSSANLARVLFRRASKIDPKHQPIWFAWGWMEWKEGNINTARELYKRALSINSTSESAARCLQCFLINAALQQAKVRLWVVDETDAFMLSLIPSSAWGVLEHRAGNLSTARMLFRSSLNINSQSYVTWTTWAAFEEEQGNAERAEEIRSLYFQQRTEVVDDASWVMGFLDIIDPAIDSVKRLLNLGRSSSDSPSSQEILRRHQMSKGGSAAEKADSGETAYFPGNINGDDGFDLDSFIKDKLALDVSKLNDNLEMFDSMKNSSIKKRYARIRRENSGLPAMG